MRKYKFNPRKILFLRQRAGLSTTDIAFLMRALFGVKLSPQAVNGWELGRSGITAERLGYLASLLNANVEDFYDVTTIDADPETILEAFSNQE